MNYVSTRNKRLRMTASQAIIQGLAPDGGLMTPEVLPRLPGNALESMKDMSYQQRVVYILGRFLDEFSARELSSFAGAAYGRNFDTPAIAPVHPLGSGVSCLELWHGPTCAFKDMALQMLPHLLSASLDKMDEEKTACILVATSGDTGKAALEGFKDVARTKILVFYPKDGVPDIQQLQMVTQNGGPGGAGVLPVLGQLHQLGAGAAPDRLLYRRLLRPAAGRGRLRWAAHQRVRAHRQLRQHPGGLLRQADGGAHQDPDLRLQ